MNAIKLYRGVSIYKVEGSENWYVCVWDRERQRYIVKTTGVRTGPLWVESRHRITSASRPLTPDSRHSADELA
jgi:hypothetical protein